MQKGLPLRTQSVRLLSSHCSLTKEPKLPAPVRYVPHMYPIQCMPLQRLPQYRASKDTTASPSVKTQGTAMH